MSTTKYFQNFERRSRHYTADCSFNVDRDSKQNIFPGSISANKTNNILSYNRNNITPNNNNNNNNNNRICKNCPN